jgi:protoporphyrinogen oxidase
MQRRKSLSKELYAHSFPFILLLPFELLVVGTNEAFVTAPLQVESFSFGKQNFASWCVNFHSREVLSSLPAPLLSGYFSE